MKKQVEGEGEHLVRVAFERVPGERGGVFVARSLDVRGLGLEQIVEGVAVHFGCAAGAPRFAVEAYQTYLGWIFVARTAGDEHRSRDEGQLVIFLKKEDDAIRQLDALGLLGLEVVEFGDGDFLPGLVLLGVEGNGREQGDADGSRYGGSGEDAGYWLIQWKTCLRG